jgi:hypothetical protein
MLFVVLLELLAAWAASMVNSRAIVTSALEVALSMCELQAEE